MIVSLNTKFHIWYSMKEFFYRVTIKPHTDIKHNNTLGYFYISAYINIGEEDIYDSSYTN